MIDITRPVHSGMALYPGNPPVTFTPVRVASSAASALTLISLGSHTGTHLDAPAHLDDTGRGTSSYSLDQLNGPCEVLDLTAATRVILAADLANRQGGAAATGERILIKTANSSGHIDVFDPEFVALSDTAAQELVRWGIRLVGIDAPSIKRQGVKDDVHRLLLEAGIAILEGLWLADVPAGQYELLCLPLAVDLDGAPVRAVLGPLPAAR